MTSTSDAADGGPLATPPTSGRAQTLWTRVATTLLERAQDVVSSVTGIVLILLAASLLGSAIYEFFHRLSGTSLATNATDLLDSVLLVLILVEIVHTVVLSLKAHALVPQPFIVVGLVAVIRRLLFVLGNQEKISDTLLWIYVALVVVFVASLVAINRFAPNSSANRDQS